MKTLSHVQRLLFFAAFALVSACSVPEALTAPSVVSNVRAAQRPGTHLVDVYYNVSDPDGNSPLTVYVAVSANAGVNYNVPVFTLQGAVGPGVTPGNDRLITWNAGTDWSGRFSTECRVKVLADDNTLPRASGRMVFIPAGRFAMGDALDSGSSALPVHTLTVSAFLMDQFEVTGELWADVAAWANTRGYAFPSAVRAKGLNHPANAMNWYDAIKWCNARSEKEGLAPCYYTDVAHTTVYRSGNVTLTNANVKWTATGYRLPTEAEWERAARGGLTGKRFPWGDTITHTNANYSSFGNYAFDVSSTSGSHPTYTTGGQPYTSPVGVFAPNGYGLYDMAGNVSEWVWDWYDSSWYGQPGAGNDDSRGPAPIYSNRVFRGGAWFNSAAEPRCASRGYKEPYHVSGVNPDTADYGLGFRTARGL